jgi:hypothetical protein
MNNKILKTNNNLFLDEHDHIIFSPCCVHAQITVVGVVTVCLHVVNSTLLCLYHNLTSHNVVSCEKIVQKLLFVIRGAKRFLTPHEMFLKYLPPAMAEEFYCFLMVNSGVQPQLNN